MCVKFVCLFVCFVVIAKTTFWENVTMEIKGMLYIEDTLVEIWRNMYMGRGLERRFLKPCSYMVSANCENCNL